MSIKPYCKKPLTVLSEGYFYGLACNADKLNGREDKRSLVRLEDIDTEGFDGADEIGAIRTEVNRPDLRVRRIGGDKFGFVVELLRIGEGEEEEKKI